MWENYKSTKSESDTRKEIFYILSEVFKERMSINDIVNSFTVSLSILLRDSFSDKIIGFVPCPAQPRAAHWQWDLFVVTRQFYPANHKSSLVTANRYSAATSLHTGLAQSQTHLKIFSCEELNSHDGEDEPEDDTDHQHIEDTGDGLDQGINDNLREKMCEVSV